MPELQIHIPREHDSFSELAINSERLLVRFTYNDTFDCWSFGIYELNRQPIIEGLRIVPNFPLLLYFPMRRFDGVNFIATCNRQHIVYRDFWDGNAKFWMVTK
jgi:hypothetical protein